jgi:hypothetical protein
VTTTIPSPLDAPDDGDRRSRGWTWPRIAAAVVVVGLIGFWVYIFASADDYHPAGYLTDRTFPKAAEPVCAASMHQLDALPPAHSAKNADARADTVDRADDILRDMQRRLRTVVPHTKDAKYIDQWIDDWSIFISDRDRYAAHLRKDPGAEYLVTQKYGSQISESLDNYADVNTMPSCDTPNDV